MQCLAITADLRITTLDSPGQRHSQCLRVAPCAKINRQDAAVVYTTDRLGENAVSRVNKATASSDGAKCYSGGHSIGVTSYGALGHVPPLELGHVKKFGSFYDNNKH